MAFYNFFFNKGKYALMPVDFLVGVLSFYLAFYWRFDGSIPGLYLNSFVNLWYFYAFIKISIFMILGVYKRVWKYAAAKDLLYVINTLMLTVLGFVTLSFFLQIPVPRSIFIFTFMMDVIISGGVRVIPKLYIEKGNVSNDNKGLKRLLVVGAGDAGVLVVKELLRQESPTMLPLGFIDDDMDKQNLKILGLPVLGTRAQLNEIITKNDIQEILIAMPSAAGQVIREIYETCKRNNIPVRTLPRMYDIINGQITVDLIREVKLEDLLGREPVNLDIDLIMKSFSKKKILVTGAGGSIGSELCRQICRCNPSELVLLGHDENPIFEIEQELVTQFPAIKISTAICDIKDYERVFQVFEEYKPQVVFHAAAHKHVPLMEHNPGESFKNNVMGTRNVALAADSFLAETFVLISTDKAVNPTSIMGATKRIAEMVVQKMNGISKTKYTAVRFGNVLGSRGSVIPIFQEQIRQGGPVTVTHPEMRRYFMTIPEAVQLVLQAAGMAQGGEIFVLDMGEPVKIVDMARELIRLSGFEPDKDIAIQFTGIRPGEKLYEEILTNEEGSTATINRRIYIANKQDFNENQLDILINNCAIYKNYNRNGIFELLAVLENHQGMLKDNSYIS